MKIRALLFVLIVTLFGCKDKTIVKPPLDNKIQNCKVEFDIQPPPPLILRDVRFKVLTLDIMKDIVQSEQQVTFIAITPDDYEKLSLNMVDIRNLLEYNRKTYFVIKDYYSNPNIESDSSIQETKPKVE